MERGGEQRSGYRINEHVTTVDNLIVYTYAQVNNHLAVPLAKAIHAPSIHISS